MQRNGPPVLLVDQHEFRRATPRRILFAAGVAIATDVFDDDVTTALGHVNLQTWFDDGFGRRSLLVMIVLPGTRSGTRSRLDVTRSNQIILDGGVNVFLGATRRMRRRRLVVT